MKQIKVKKYILEIIYFLDLKQGVVQSWHGSWQVLMVKYNVITGMRKIVMIGWHSKLMII